MLPPGSLPPTLLLLVERVDTTELHEFGAGRAIHLAEDSAENIWMLGFECASLDALGISALPDGRRALPSVRLRAPERLFHLDVSESPFWREAPVTAETLADVPLAFGLPGACLRWAPQDSPTGTERIGGPSVTIGLPDGRVLAFTRGVGRERGARIFGASGVEYIELPSDFDVDAAQLDGAGLLWLHSVSGGLRRGPVGALAFLDDQFERFPDGPPREPACLGDGSLHRLRMSVRARTSTDADVLISDSSGRVTRFVRGRWTILSDVVAGDPAHPFACTIAYPEVVWISKTEALNLNPTLGPQAVSRLRFSSDGSMIVIDDGAPDAGISSGVLLELGERGVFATSGLDGLIVHRSRGAWRVFEGTASLSGVSTFLIEGPADSLLFGSDKDGFRQYWPGMEVCRDGAEHLGHRWLLPFGSDGYLSFHAGVGPVRAWRLEPPSACDPYPE